MCVIPGYFLICRDEPQNFITQTVFCANQISRILVITIRNKCFSLTCKADSSQCSIDRLNPSFTGANGSQIVFREFQCILGIVFFGSNEIRLEKITSSKIRFSRKLQFKPMNLLLLRHIQFLPFMMEK